MKIDKGIDIENGVKINCPKCGQLLAIKNEKGQILLRHVVIAYFDLHENRCELKCRGCKDVTLIKDLT